MTRTGDDADRPGGRQETDRPGGRTGNCAAICRKKAGQVLPADL
jgi:hypothetical protein